MLLFFFGVPHAAAAIPVTIMSRFAKRFSAFRIFIDENTWDHYLTFHFLLLFAKTFIEFSGSICYTDSPRYLRKSFLLILILELIIRI